MDSIVEVNSVERWSIYHRLQELQLPCQCASYQPLQVKIHDTTAAIQLWSVVRQLTAPRCELVNWLEKCWRIQAYSQEY